jgi:ABC-2 type transport system ATP-binding protein
MPDHYGVYPDLTIRDYLEFYSRAYGIPRDVRLSRINNIMEFTGLDRIDGKKVDALSKGMMQRLNMGRGLLNDPRILVLDEPAAGLDPRARIELRYLLKQLAAQGRTIFISSHILTELAEMCDEMLIIDRGRQVMFGTVDQIQAEMQETVEISMKLLEPAVHGQRLETWLMEQPHVEDLAVNESGVVRLNYPGDKRQCAELLTRIVTAGFPIIEFRPVLLSMEEVFMQITESEITE